MTFDYARAAATASRLITQFGQPATLRKPGAKTGAVYDRTIGAPTDYPVTLVDLNRSVRDRAGTLVGEAVRTIYVSTAGLTVPLEKADTVQIGGQWCEIAEVRPLNPGGVMVFWEADLVA